LNCNYVVEVYNVCVSGRIIHRVKDLVTTGRGSKRLTGSNCGWWRFGGAIYIALVSISEIYASSPQLVVRWSISSRHLTSQPPTTTQPGHPFVGRSIEYQHRHSSTSRLLTGWTAIVNGRWAPRLRSSWCTAHCLRRRWQLRC